jgi:hypothetical protein
MYIQRNPTEIETPAHRNLFGRKQDCPAACVIAQQYSSATFVSLLFHPIMETFVTHSRHVIFDLLNIFLKFREIIQG